MLPYQRRWAEEGSTLVQRLTDLAPGAIGIDHIGSTSVPGLAAKDCLDAMIRVDSLESVDLDGLVSSGFRERPEVWSRSESIDGVSIPKRVFAPSVGGRAVNVHVRLDGSATSRFALLFRDYLRADEVSRDAWGDFKLRLAESVTNIYAYGQIKQTAYPLLMRLAEQWAETAPWEPR